MRSFVLRPELHRPASGAFGGQDLAFHYVANGVSSDHYFNPFSLRILFQSFLVVSGLYSDCWGLWFCIPGRCVPCPLLGQTPLILCLPSFPLSMSHLFCWSWLLGLLQISGLRILCVRYSGQKSVAEVTSIWTAVQGSSTRQNWKGTRKGILGFKGCSPASSYPPQVSYLVSPPGLSIASYSRVCRTYLCNNLTNMNAILHLKARTPKTLKSSSHSCPTCVGEHSKSCLPNFVSSESCPRDATKCYSSTVKVQAGFLNTTFLLMGCAREHTSVFAHFHHIGSIRVTEVINIVEKALFTGAGTPCRSPSWGILLGLLFAFKG
ncbi:ly6/PLAUR domain-containing protein 4 isoform X3 [Bos taurus]|uniref:ly6/PLAUR domain-containing protein 4 isoform X3 n=1 Tax=Bos taurus TaxID=9913 RepID=UPI0028CB2573|nr:ly6/PLAUR domain-containing protein 4 isoform X3 [Bos taurus]